jgi:hypothetical protein
LEPSGPGMGRGTRATARLRLALGCHSGPRKLTKLTPQRALLASCAEDVARGGVCVGSVGLSQIGRNAAIPYAYACVGEGCAGFVGRRGADAEAGRTERWLRELSLVPPGERSGAVIPNAVL